MEPIITSSDLACEDKGLEAIIEKVINCHSQLTQPVNKTKEFTVTTTSVVMISISSLGFLINFAAAVFLTWKLKTHYSPFLRLLRALALSDLCVMITGALLYGLPGISAQYSFEIYPMIAPYLLPIAQTSIMTSVYLAVVMAFERYIRICFICQLRSTRILTDKNLRFYIWACLLFPVLFYIPKWFELRYGQDLPRACYELRETSECLMTSRGNESDVQESLDEKISHVNWRIAQLLSMFCWKQGTPVQKNLAWDLRSTPLRFNIVYYISYYMTLNTLFATILPIGGLLFFSLSTIGGLHSIRKHVRTSVPMRMSSARHQTNLAKAKVTARPSENAIELEQLTSNEEQPEKVDQKTRSKSFKDKTKIRFTNQESTTSTVESHRKNVSEPSAQEKRLTRISFVLIIIYVLCHIWKLPPSIYEAWYSISHNTTTHVQWPDWLHVVHDISHVLILANSAFNFIIYLVL